MLSFVLWKLRFLEGKSLPSAAGQGARFSVTLLGAWGWGLGERVLVTWCQEEVEQVISLSHNPTALGRVPVQGGMGYREHFSSVTWGTGVSACCHWVLRRMSHKEGCFPKMRGRTGGLGRLQKLSPCNIYSFKLNKYLYQ